MYVPLGEKLTSAGRKSTVKVVPPAARRTLQVIYRLRHDARVKIKLINSEGKIRQEIDLGKVSEGVHTSQVDVSRVPSGIYSLQIFRGKAAKPTRQTVVLY